MGEVAALTTAFDVEISKAISFLLPVTTKDDVHEAALIHHRLATKVAEVVDHYTARLPAYIIVPRLIQNGWRLFEAGELEIALYSCFTYIHRLQLHSQVDVLRIDAVQKISYHVQACYGCTLCRVMLKLKSDPQIRHIITLEIILDSLQQLKEALILALPKEDLLWLSMNGTLHIYKLCKELMHYGFSQHALPYLVYCIKSIEAHILFNTAKYLAWRMLLYQTACYAYCDIDAFEAGKSLVMNGLSELKRLEQLHALDPVPVAPEIIKQFTAARSTLNVLLLKLEALMLNSAAVQQYFQTSSEEDDIKLQALLEALNNPKQRILLYKPPEPAAKDLFNMASQSATPLIGQLKEILQQPDETESTTVSDELLQKRDKVSKAFSLHLHKALLCVAFNQGQSALVKDLIDLGKLRVQHGPIGMQSPNDMSAFSAVVTIVDCASKLTSTPGPESIQESASALRQIASIAGPSSPELLADAALLLHNASKKMIHGVACMQDQDAELVLDALRCLHSCFEHTSFDDGVLRLTVAQKLALLLEESGELMEARVVLSQTLVTTQTFRVEGLLKGRLSADEGLRWISGSRSQCAAPTSELLGGISDTDQELATLHTDVLAVYFRVQLRVGVIDQQLRADHKKTKMIENFSKRDALSNIFGVRTAKEKRTADMQITELEHLPPTPGVVERELQTAVGKNMYEKALLQLTIAQYQPEAFKQQALLQEAADLLIKAQGAEDSLFAAAQPVLKGRRDTPLQPRILQRSTTSVTLTHFPFSLKSNKVPATWSVFCKSFGAGVALTINKTATVYPGTGIQVPIGEDITITGLKTNETYVFAIAAYDSAGQVINGLGVSSPEVLISLPLPLYHVWAALLMVATKLKHWSVARQAFKVLATHFINTTPDRPLWEANPMDAQSLNRLSLSVACKPLLRAFVQAVYMYSGQQLLEDSRHLGMRATCPYEADLRQPYLEEQVARMKSCRRLLLAMQVCTLLPDEMLLEEGAVRVYNLLGPLLAIPVKSVMLHKALASVYLSLQEVHNLAQRSLVGQEQQRELASRVANISAYQLVVMSSGKNELRVANVFGKLQAEVMQAYDPRCTMPGRDPATSLQEEAHATQTYLLTHPNLTEMGSTVLNERMKDPEDLAARVLPLIGGANPLDAWAGGLGIEDTVEDPRWVELCCRMMEAAVQRGKVQGLADYLGQVTWHVKQAMLIPKLDFERWSLASASETAEALPALIQETPKPSLEGLAEDEKVAAETRYTAAQQEAVAKAKKMLASVILLQQRLPVLMARRKAVMAARERARRWLPWLSRLWLVRGMVEVTTARTWLADKPAREAAAALEAEARAAAEAEQADSGSPSGSPPRDKKDGRSGSPKTKEARASSPKAGAKGAAPKATKKGAKETVTEAPVVEEIPPPIAALIFFSRSANLALRCGAHHELLNAVRHVWNTVRLTSASAPEMVTPPPRVEWVVGPAPPPPQPPPSLLVAREVKKAGKEVKGKGAKPDPKAKEKDVKGKGGKEDPKKAAKGKKEAEPVEMKPYPQPKITKGVLSRPVALTAQSLLLFVAKVKTGLPFFSGQIPLGHGDEDEEGPGRRPLTAQTYVSSKFSLGSDVQAELWFQQGSLDMEFTRRWMQVALLLLLRMERYNTVVQLGTFWGSLSEGAYHESVLPYLISAGAECETDVTPWQTALELMMRDKSQALTHLDKTRLLMKEKLGEVTLVNQSLVGLVKKRRRPPLTRSTSSKNQSKFDDSASMITTVTMAKSIRSSVPDFQRLPAEYTKVIEILKKNGEKGAMILAMNEMGDVHAHFGNWREASIAWSDTLDTLLGPYQVIKCWRKHLSSMSPPATLQAYGLHGLLLAGGVLCGKLARYTYYDNLSARLNAARLAAALLGAPLFCVSATHPQRPLGFATYVPNELYEGVKLFNDPYRVNLTDLSSGLETVVSVLTERRLPLEALPVISLWEHVGARVTRNLSATVSARLGRVKALVQLGCAAEAVEVLVSLINATGLPDPVMDSSWVVLADDGTVVVRPNVPAYQAHLPPGHPANKECITFLMEASMHEAIQKLYGSWLVALVTMVRAEVLTLLGSLPNCWRACDPLLGQKPPESQAQPIEPVEASLLNKAVALLGSVADAARFGQATIRGNAGDSNDAKETSKKEGKSASDKKDKKTAAAPVSHNDAQPQVELGFYTEDPLGDAQRAVMLAEALIVLSAVELLRWYPQKAVDAASAAIRHIAAVADEVNGRLNENDELERYSLRPSTWLRASLALVVAGTTQRDCTHVYAMVERMMGEAEALGDELAPAELSQMRAEMLVLEGRSTEALAAYQGVLGRYTKASIMDDRLVSSLLDVARLADRMGLRADSEAFAYRALELARNNALAGGLKEMQEHTELVNIYTSTVPLYVSALQASATSLHRHRKFSEAAEQLSLALQLQARYSRSLPPHCAACALQLGRALRNQLMDPERPAVEAEEAAAQVTKVKEVLNRAVMLACQDGSQPVMLVRDALMELACLAAGAQDAPGTLLLLRAAAAAAAKHDALQHSSHLLAPVTVKDMPAWLLALIQGQEAAFNVQQGKPVDGATALTDVELGRAVVAFVARCRRSEPAACCRSTMASSLITMAAHEFLLAACPKYRSEACFDEPPPSASIPKTLVPGLVVVQWYVQDGCIKEPKSWDAEGAKLDSSSASNSDALRLAAVMPRASLIYLVVTPTFTKCGEMVIDVSVVRSLQAKVKQFRWRMDHPRGPRDLVGQDPPSAQDMMSLCSEVERLILGKKVRLNANGTIYRNDGDNLSSASSSGSGGLPAGAPTTPALDLAWLMKLEAMLSVESGLDVVDMAFAEWLAFLWPMLSI